ncbi:MAG: UvrD-helicase domain-containing protein, partial [Chthoniobacterales bacterium]
VTRCLELLARGEAPEKILALTFTRKAAAEFLQKLFGRLSIAAADPAALAQLRTEVGMPDLDAARCTEWLRQLTAALPKLSMGTMDGFFGRIFRSFPLELGLGREPCLLDEAAMVEHRRSAVDHLFSAAAENTVGLDQIVELLRRESRNRSDRSVFDTMESAARSLQQTFLETPVGIVWGDAARIWPDGVGILGAGGVEDAVRELQAEIAATHSQLGAKARAQWNKWFELALAHRPPRRMDEDLDKFLKDKLAGGSTDNKTGELYVPVGNKAEDRLYLRGRLPELRENLRRALVKLEVQARLESTRALHALLARYEQVYDSAVRETGALTFSDITNFLAAGAREAWRRDLDYRLDGRHDHWLLDEFQDTSRAQWQILEPLADEIIQDTSDARTFFYVGDTKQAIYGWRGGDARLFWEIRDHYNRGRSAEVKEEKLPVSHRSSRAIVRAVGSVLAPSVLEAQADEFRFSEKTLAAWQQAWVDHRAADDAAEGYARLQMVEPRDAEESKDEAVSRHVVDLLREAKPLERGLDCAILFRTNDELARYVSVLKAAGIPAAAEG